MQRPDNLPSWAEWNSGQVMVDMDTVVPYYLSLLGLQSSQFSLGVAKLNITRDLAEITKIEGLRVRFIGNEGWRDENLSDLHGSHDEGMRAGGKFRQRLLQRRAEQAIISE